MNPGLWLVLGESGLKPTEVPEREPVRSVVATYCYRLTVFRTSLNDGFGPRFSRITKNATEPRVHEQGCLTTALPPSLPQQCPNPIGLSYRT